MRKQQRRNEEAMKKWIRYISFLLFAVILPFHASAETTSSGVLTVTENKVAVDLVIPAGKTENITSLRFQMYIFTDTGKIETPNFTFSETITSTVKDIAVTEDTNKDGSYLIDIVLSGKKEQDIFKDTEKASIGTLSLNSALAGESFQATVGIAGETQNDGENTGENSGKPVIKYVNGTGQSEQTLFLSNTDAVTVSYTNQKPTDPDTPVTPENPTNPTTPPTNSIISGGGSTGSNSSDTDSSEEPKDEQPENPNDNKPNTEPPKDSDPANTPNQPDTDSSNNSTPVFDQTKKTKLKASVKNGSKQVVLQWKQVDGADGYIIYQYDKDTKQYKRIKTISNPDKTIFSKKLDYNSSYRFKIRAFQTAEDGSKIYGKQGAAIKVNTAPSKVKGLKIQSQNAAKPVLTWKKVPKAKGYQIFYSAKKNGKYSLLKTIKNGNTTKYAKLKQKNGKTYYYQVRAYTTDTNHSRLYGKFSASIS